MLKLRCFVPNSKCWNLKPMSWPSEVRQPSASQPENIPGFKVANLVRRLVIYGASLSVLFRNCQLHIWHYANHSSLSSTLMILYHTPSWSIKVRIMREELEEALVAQAQNGPSRCHRRNSLPFLRHTSRQTFCAANLWPLEKQSLWTTASSSAVLHQLIIWMEEENIT